MKLFKNQRGFGVIEGLLVIIALTLIVFVIFYVHNANKKTDETLNSNAGSATQQAVGKGSGSQNDYMTIKELGLKADKSSIPGAYYKIDTESADPNFPEVKYIDLYDKAYDDTTNSKGVKCSDANTYDAPLGKVEVISKAVRDAKYSSYANQSPTVDFPIVLSDKSNKEKDGMLYAYMNIEGVQAIPNCIPEADSSDPQTKDKNVFAQLEKSRTGLEELSSSFIKE